MKRRNIVLAIVAAFYFSGAQAETPTKPLPQIKPKIQPTPQITPQIKPGLIKPQGCPDMTVGRVSVYIVQPLSNGDERSNFMVEIRNNGSMEYQPTTPRAAEMHLYVQDTGGGQRTLNRHYLGNARASGGSNFFSSYINWSRSVEFPPSVVAEIRYLDPEYATDGSRANDDCNINNNRFVLNGAEINRQLAAKRR